MGFVTKGNSDATEGKVNVGGEASGGAMGKLWEKVMGAIAFDVGRTKSIKGSMTGGLIVNE